MRLSSRAERSLAVALSLATLLVLPAVARAQTKAPPDTSQVDAQTIDQGRAIFHGQGQCLMCHGAGLEGGIGPTLRAHKWKDADDGNIAAIYRIVTHGVPGTAMVAYPGGIDDAMARKVVTYVWAVSHGRARP